MNINTRPIKKFDIETLRVWKNANRQAFFCKYVITEEQQELWYQGYWIRNLHGLDFMYIVQCNGIDVGCIGYRIINRSIDLYNIMLGDTAFKGKGIIKQALKLLWNYLRNKYDIPITVKVLLDNYKMWEWYILNNWSIAEVGKDYILLTYKGGLKYEND